MYNKYISSAFDEYWIQCLSLAFSEKQRQIMWRTKNFYEDAFEEGLSPEEIMQEEWGL